MCDEPSLASISMAAVYSDSAKSLNDLLRIKARLFFVPFLCLSVCVCVFVCTSADWATLRREIPSVLFHFQLIVFQQTTVISSFPLIISISFHFPLSFCFKFLFFGPLSLDNIFLSSCAAFLSLFASVFLGTFSHSVSYLFVSLPVCLCVFRPVSPLCNSLSPSWVSLSFSFPFTWSLSAVLGIPSVSCYSGWLCFHPVAYQHDLRFISLCMHVCVCVWAYACASVRTCVFGTSKAWY